MRIAYIAACFGENGTVKRLGGKASSHAATQKIFSFIQAMQQFGHDITIISPGWPNRKSGKFFGYDQENISLLGGQVILYYAPTIDVPIMNRLCANLFVPILLKKLHNIKPFDICLLYNVDDWILQVAKLAKKLNIPCVLEYEDDALASRNGRLKKISYSYCKKNLDGVNILTNGALLVTPELKDQLNTNNCAIVRGILSDDMMQEPHFEQSLEKCVNIVYAGGLFFDKGPDILIKALESINLKVTLDIFGEGPLMAEMYDLIRTLPRHHKVTCHGYVRRDILVKYMFNADILVNPHRVNYGNCFCGKLSPFKLIEYCSIGKPVISSKVVTLSDEEFYSGGIMWYEEDSPSALAEAINNVFLNYDEWKNKALLMAKDIKQKFSLLAVGKKIDKVLNDANLNRIK